MQMRPTRAATRHMAVRRARMGLIFTAVGMVWLGVALASAGRFTSSTLTFCSMAGASALVAALVLLRRAPRLPLEPLSPAQKLRIRRIVTAVNILEWVAVATAFAVLMLLHLPAYIPTAAGIIVGLYLYPIAAALRAPLHTVTATLLVAWNVAALALLPPTRQMTLGAAGTASILLISAAITLGWALWRTRLDSTPLTVPAPASR